MKIILSDEVAGGLHFDKPVVALESTVIAHGLPNPKNLETAYKLERIVRDVGAVPATIAVFGGDVYIGLNDDQLERLATGKDIRKISRRDIPIAAARRLDCATTVATTAFFAHRAGLRVFATGGIGGVHRGNARDVSADLPELATTPIVVVCSGAKIILDLPATREWLETNGITVLGWQCDDFPAFYSRSSGLAVDERVDSARDVIEIAEARNDMGMRNAILVAVPVPERYEISIDEIERFLAEAMRSAEEENVRGKELTPFLLAQLSSKSNGRTLEANVALLENNARVAARIATGL